MRALTIAALLAAPLLACSDPAPAGADAVTGGADAATDGAAQDASAEDVATADAAPDVGPSPPDPLDLVDPFVGTGSLGGNYGALYPGATLPFGMVAVSPDTDGLVGWQAGVLHASGYFYHDDEVMGFSHIHLAGVGVEDYGNLMVTPQVGDPAALTAAIGAANLPLDHALEEASPGYYRLEVTEPALVAELTATLRAAIHRYTFQDAEGHLVVDVTHYIGGGDIADSSVTVDAATGEVRGFVHNVGAFTKRFGGFELFFVARPSRPPTAVGVFDGDGWHAGQTTAGGTRSGAVLTFDTATDGVVELRVAVSFVDVEGAEKNLLAEVDGVSFEDAHAAARATWREALGVMEVAADGNPDDTRLRLLYTSLYHAQLMPNLLMDVDGRYRGLDKEVHVADGFTYYSDFSMWDTYRTFHPLASLLFPAEQLDFMHSLTAMAADGGTMPQWPLAIGYSGSMIGTSADIVIGDAYLKGTTDFDVEAAYQAMKTLATGPAPMGHPGRDDYELCDQYEYCPADLVGGSVSKTLEYSADDYCLARLAEALGKPDDAAFFDGRVDRWQHHFEPTKGFLAPRTSTGEFLEYSPKTATKHYIEGSPWHYLFMVPHDVPDLVTLLGGEAAFAAKLSEMMGLGREHFRFELPNGYYFHGNEPDIVAPWLFAFGGRQDLTTSWVAWVADTAYALDSGGLVGNDDGGTLSSWYVFAAAGLYPLPCTGEYALAAPLFDEVVLHLPGGDLVVRRGEDPDGPLTFDGAPITGPTLSHATIASGGVLELPPPKPLPAR